MPRPSSSTVTLLSMWIFTAIAVQCPASASSIELSTTSNTRWCRPRSPVSPMYMPGRLRTASSPSRTLMFSAPYSGACASPLLIAVDCRSRTQNYTAAGSGLPHSDRLPRGVSESHRHEDVRERGVLRAVHDSRSDLVGEPELDNVAGRVDAEHVEQV